MQILLLEEVDSTQRWLKEELKSNRLQAPVAVYAKRQTQGVGSRGNSWIGEEGNLFLSFALPKASLPGDLKMESASIYFAMLLKDVLEEYGSKVWIKWPNDFYLGEKKIGGMITSIVGSNLLCGVGLNIVAAPEGFEKLDVVIALEMLVEQFMKKVEKNVSWKQVFRKYSVEFYKNESFYTHIGNERKLSLRGAKLQEDGSIVINGERIYSLR